MKLIYALGFLPLLVTGSIAVTAAESSSDAEMEKLAANADRKAMMLRSIFIFSGRFKSNGASGYDVTRNAGEIAIIIDESLRLGCQATNGRDLLSQPETRTALAMGMKIRSAGVQVGSRGEFEREIQIQLEDANRVLQPVVAVATCRLK